MSDKSKILGTFVLGAVVGIALVKLLESDKGQEFMESAKDKAMSAADDIKNKIKQLETELAELIQTQTDQSNDHTT